MNLTDKLKAVTDLTKVLEAWDKKNNDSNVVIQLDVGFDGDPEGAFATLTRRPMAGWSLELKGRDGF